MAADKEHIVKDEDTGRITEVHTDQHVSADSDLAVQIPDEVNRDADEFENTRNAPSPAEQAESASKKSSSAKKSD